MAIKGMLLDLDGTVYLGEAEVTGASAFVREMKRRGIRILFVTNRANRTPETVSEHLRQYGIDCGPGDVLTSAEATALYLKRGTYYVIGEEGLERALREQGLTFNAVCPDYVIVGYDRQFSYDKLATACRLIGHGAALIATNPDSALKTSEGVLPGTGALVAAVATGSGAKPLCIGKPERRIFELAIERLGLDKDEVIAVGDNIETDIPAGFAAGIRTALILTGNSTRADAGRAAIQPTWIVEGYEELRAIIEDETE
jgi:4-nitrophenyl phosphatase